MQKSRKINNYILYIKALATILVVFVHSGNLLQYANFTQPHYPLKALGVVSAAAVPMFFVTSAYLLYSKPFAWKENIRKKIRTLLIPLCIWNAFWVIFECIGYKILPAYFDDMLGMSIVEWAKTFFGIPFTDKAPYYSALWFVRELFLLNLGAVIIGRIIKKTKPWIMNLLLLIIWFSPINKFSRQAICFFAFGAIIAIYKPKIEMKELIIPACISGGIAIAIATFSKAPEYSVLQRIAPLLSTFALSIGVFYLKDKRITVLDKLAPYSFAIYVMHGKLLSVMQILVSRFVIQNYLTIAIEYFVLPCIAIMICILGAYILRSITPSFYAIAMGRRTK